MRELLANPAVQAGLLPFIAALVVAAMLARTRFAWLAIVAGYATMVAMTTGFTFAPLSASRKVLLLVLLAPLVGLAADAAGSKGRGAATLLGVGGGAAALWSVSTVLVQRPLLEALALGALVFAFSGMLVWLTLRLRSDGPAAGAAGLGLGIATGLAALLSASIGYFMAGIAVAVACGAILLVQIAAGRAIVAGLAGTLSIGLTTALLASASVMIARLPWYALPAMLLVPGAASLDAGVKWPTWLRCVLLALASMAAAVVPVFAAWFATGAR